MHIADVTAWTMLAALAAYVVLGGADFGAGVWDLLASGPRRARQRELIAHAIGPIWETNHVWLIVVVVLLFTAFPPAFSAIMTALHIPITLMLLGVVMRGSAFAFRSYGPPGAPRDRWGRVFSVSSTLAPALLGVTLATCASGALRFDASGAFTGSYFTPWLRPFPWCAGLFTLALVAHLAAVCLCVEAEGARDAALTSDFRVRAIASGVCAGALAMLTWILAGLTGADVLARGLAGGAGAIGVQVGAALSALACLAALWRRRYRIARVCAAALAVLVVVGYGVATFPYLVVPDITIAQAAAPPVTHRALLVTLAVGTLILAPSLALLYRVFRPGAPTPSPAADGPGAP